MLSRRDIEKELGREINIVPLIRSNFKENSINLTASHNAWTTGMGTVYWFGGLNFGPSDGPKKIGAKTFKKGDNCVFYAKHREHSEKIIILLPHATTLIETSEVIGVGSKIGGALHSKVGLVSKGVGHIGTMLGPGYCGHLLIALHNITDDIIAIRVGSTFVSLSFDYLNTTVPRTSTTVSGHIDKFSELGITINEETRAYLTEDWKSTISGIREKMVATDAYKEYRNYIKQNKWKELRNYLSKRNIIAIIVALVILVGFYYIAQTLDSNLPNPIWVDRFWNVGLSGCVGSLIIGLIRFIRDEK